MGIITAAITNLSTPFLSSYLAICEYFHILYERASIAFIVKSQSTNNRKYFTTFVGNRRSWYVLYHIINVFRIWSSNDMTILSLLLNHRHSTNLMTWYQIYALIIVLYEYDVYYNPNFNNMMHFMRWFWCRPFVMNILQDYFSDAKKCPWEYFENLYEDPFRRKLGMDPDHVSLKSTTKLYHYGPGVCFL